MSFMKISTLKIIIFSRLLSHLGSSLSHIVLTMRLWEVTQNVFLISISLISYLFSGILSSFLLGFIADKFNRRQLIVLSDLLLAILVIIFAFIPDKFFVSYSFVFMFSLGVLASLSGICIRASWPSLTNKKNMKMVNGIMYCGANVLSSVAGLIATFSGLLTLNYKMIFLFDGITYFISVISLLLISKARFVSEIKNEISSQKTSIDNNISVKNTLNELISSYLSIIKMNERKIIFLFLGVMLLDAVASASHNIGFPIFSKDLDKNNSLYIYGLITAGLGIGNVVGFFILYKNKMLNKLEAGSLYIAFTGVMSIGHILIFQTKMLYFIICSAILAGIGDGIYQSYYSLYVQNLEVNIRGKVFAITNFVINGGFLIGYLTFPLLLSFIKVDLGVFIFHLPIIFFVFSWFVILKNKLLVSKNCKT